MINIIPSDQQVFESVLRSYEHFRAAAEGSPASNQLNSTMESLADIVRKSDLLQKIITIVELQVMRSNNPDAMASALLTFMLLGTEIGATLHQQRGAELIAPEGAKDNVVN